MNTKTLTRIIALAVLVSLPGVSLAADSTEKRPNILLAIADDWG